MQVKFWGTRGSVPVPGPSTVRYGGNTTCLEVKGKDGTHLIIDSGTGIRLLGGELMSKGPKGPIHVILTHFHWDHIQGWPFFIPAYVPGFEFNIYGRGESAEKLKRAFGYQMRSPYFPVKFSAQGSEKEFVSLKEGSFNIGTLKIQVIENCHPGGAFGLRITEGGKSFVLLTDHEIGLRDRLPHPYSDYVRFAKNAHLLIHDAQFDDEELPQRRGWGHSSHTEALKLALKSDAKKLGLFHHSPSRADSGIDGLILHCEEILEKEKGSMEVFGAREGSEIEIS